MADYSGPLRQLVEKMLLHRGHRGASCRVFAPAGSLHAYTVTLDEKGVRDSFFIELHHVEKFSETGNEQFVLNEIRNGIRNFDRIITKKKTARGH